MPGGFIVDPPIAAEAVQTIGRFLDLFGVLANAILGGIIAREKNFDIVGFATLAIMTGLGGGLIRDILLQHGPPTALTDYAYILTALAGAFVAFLIPVNRRAWDRFFPYVDAMALATWAAAGAAKTLGVGLGWLPAILLGVITAVGGGTLRDISIRRVPSVFGGNTLYATPALLSASTMTVFYVAGSPVVGTIASLIAGMGLAIVAHHRRWVLPSAYSLRLGKIRDLPRPKFRRRRSD